MRADINISTTDQSGNKQTNKLSYVNPDATEQQYATLIDKVVGMSNNILVSAAKVETSDINLNASSLQPLNLSWQPGSTIQKTITTTYGNIKTMTTQQGGTGSYYNGMYSANSNDKLKPYIKSNSTAIPAVVATVNDNGSMTEWGIYLAVGNGYDEVSEGQSIVPSLYGKIVVAVDPDDTYAGDEITLTITEG